jgi:glycosyltransferase involved in cell wall biosynthesis
MPSSSRSVCIGVPLHNSARFISVSIGSILNQTCLPDSVIIVDDSSCDDSLEMACSLLRDDGRIPFTAIKSQNSDVHKTYNQISHLCSEDYLLILDHDDSLSSEAICVMRNILSKYPDDILVVLGISSNAMPLRWLGHLARYCRNPIVLPKSIPILGTLATRSGVLYPVMFLKRFPFPVPQFPEADVEHLHRIRSQVQTFFVPQEYVNYRIHSSSVSSNSLRNRQKPAVSGLLYFFDFHARRFFSRWLR